METFRLLLGLGARNRVAYAIQSFLRLGVITTGFGAFLVVINNLFDYALYPIGLCKMGFGWGVITLALISIPFNQFLVAGFNWIGREIVLFSWLWRPIGFILEVIGDVTIYIMALVGYMVVILALLYTSRGCLFGVYLFGTFVIVQTCEVATQVWIWVRSHVTFFAFVCISAYDPIPGMIFAQKIYGVRFWSLSYACLFLVATVVANGVWALFVVLGLEAIQTLDEDFFTFIRWSEVQTTWAVSFVDESWQADFGFLREVLGTCKI